MSETRTTSSTFKCDRCKTELVSNRRPDNWSFIKYSTPAFLWNKPTSGDLCNRCDLSLRNWWNNPENEIGN